MKILFLTIARITNISERGIYTDLMREFRDQGHEIFIVCPTERRYKEATSSKKIDGVNILSVWTLNAQKTSLIEKGFCTLFIDSQFKSGILKYFGDIKFDLILYSTPPITFTKTISFLKEKNNALTYLLLKDIFPQNAADLGLISKKGMMYKYFKAKETSLYEVSDYIGCLSQANVKYLLENNSFIDPKTVEENPNSISIVNTNISQVERDNIRFKYGIPIDDVVCVYGGNLGKPQGIDFLIDVLESAKNLIGVFYLIVGSGTELNRLMEWQAKTKPLNILIRNTLPKNDYDVLIRACDIGLIFLDKRFTIPNFPSRILSYLECRMPVLAATDKNTDIGLIIEHSQCGYWVENGNLEGFNSAIKKMAMDAELREKQGQNGFRLLKERYTVSRSYSIIMNRCKYV